MTAFAEELSERRTAAERRFRAVGLPNRRVEEWKYSDLKLAAEGLDESGAIVWIIGKRPVGVEIFDLQKIDEAVPDWVEKHFGTLPQNTMSLASFAHYRTGVAIRVPRGVAVAEILPLKLNHSGSSRILVLLEEGASLTISETQATDRFANIGFEIVVEPRARLTHLHLSWNVNAVQVAEYAVKVARDGAYKAHVVTGGAKLSRAEFNIALEGEGASAHLSGVAVLNATHADVTVHMTHAVEKTQSTQVFKYVADGHARGVYQGKVTVAQGANGSDSRQTAKGLLLQDRAEIDLKPELEILADDVKCAHGAAVGDLDAESLFYLRSRGIPEAEARALLMRAFLGDAIAQIENDAARESVWQAVDAALERVS